MKKYFVLGIIISTNFVLNAQKYTQKGILALEQDNFGLAKELFEKEFKKDSCSANFGLAHYYMAPYTFEADSAFLYLTRARQNWQALGVKEKAKRQAVLQISDSVFNNIFNELALEEFKNAEVNLSIALLEKFSLRYGEHFAQFNHMAINLRDSLAFRDASNLNTAKAFENFIVKYPNAKQLANAKSQFELLHYSEQTNTDTEAALFDFININPASPYIEDAWRRIYEKYKAAKKLDLFLTFLEKYQAAPSLYKDEAWKQIYKLYMQPYSAEKLAQFKIDYPNYPFSQDLEADGSLLLKKLYPFIENNLYGYMDAEGKIAIAAQYEEANAFVEGLAIVAFKERYGLINKKNEIIVPFDYLDISPSSSGYIAEDSSGYYILNFQGKKQQSNAQQWEELQQTLTALDWQEQITPTTSVSLYEKVTQNGKFGLKKAGKTILPIKYDELFFKGENDYILARNGKALLYFDPTGKKIEINGLEWFAAASELAMFSQDGVAVFCKGNKFGLLDKKGKVILKNSYDAVQAPFEGLYPFQQTGKWGVLGSDAQLKIPFNYSRITVLVPNGFLLENENGLGLMNKEANWLLEPAFKTIKRFENDFFLVENENGLGLYKSNGSLLLPCAYQRIVKFDDNTFQLTNSKGLTYFLLAENKIVALQP